jgi:anti-anti-sigma factor
VDRVSIPTSEVKLMGIEATQLEIKFVDIGDRMGVAVFGEVDEANCAELDAAFAAGENGDRPTLLDLEECTFIDSMGLEAIVRAAQRLADDGKRLVLCNARGQVRQLLRMTKLTDWDGFLVYRDLPR